MPPKVRLATSSAVHESASRHIDQPGREKGYRLSAPPPRLLAAGLARRLAVMAYRVFLLSLWAVRSRYIGAEKVWRLSLASMAWLEAYRSRMVQLSRWASLREWSYSRLCVQLVRGDLKSLTIAVSIHTSHVFESQHPAQSPVLLETCRTLRPRSMLFH